MEERFDDEWVTVTSWFQLVISTIFDNILNRKIPWPAVPEEMSPEAQDLIDRLLTEDPNQRLGARGASEDNNED
ncbi:hypothetical protein Ahy_A08g038957 isoform D [Arachis hypogaea]|uniref:Protein kinase domain-containing protein n=1 Tax=Arachis hypogaea TaxID=3818 RepID=A0A445BUU0_ARAHY|nr:hypothetical protein Ahy_A08g038957 isoform D [Arachis hypogaea]